MVCRSLSVIPLICKSMIYYVFLFFFTNVCIVFLFSRSVFFCVIKTKPHFCEEFLKLWAPNRKSENNENITSTVLSLPTMHVHHPWRGAVLWSRQLWAIFLIFALFLILVFLQWQKKSFLFTQKLHSTCDSVMSKPTKQELWSSDCVHGNTECITKIFLPF